MKYPFIVFLCKFVLYSICLFSLYIIGRNLLEKYGFIISPDNHIEQNNFINIEESNNNNNNNNNNDLVKLSEMTDVKIK